MHFLTVAIFLFAFTSVIGNYYYGESNIRFLSGSRAVMTGYRVLVLVFVFGGAVLALDLVWSLADLFMAFMAPVCPGSARGTAPTWSPPARTGRARSSRAPADPRLAKGRPGNDGAPPPAEKAGRRRAERRLRRRPGASRRSPRC